MISGVAADAKELLISELTLTKLEFQREFAKAKAAAVAVSIGIALDSLARYHSSSWWFTCWRRLLWYRSGGALASSAAHLFY